MSSDLVTAEWVRANGSPGVVFADRDGDPLRAELWHVVGVPVLLYGTGPDDDDPPDWKDREIMGLDAEDDDESEEYDEEEGEDVFASFADVFTLDPRSFAYLTRRVPCTAILEDYNEEPDMVVWVWAAADRERASGCVLQLLQAGKVVGTFTQHGVGADRKA